MTTTSPKTRKRAPSAAGAQAGQRKTKKRAPFTYEPTPQYSDDFKAETVRQALAHIEEGLSLISFCEEKGLRFGNVWRWIEASEKDTSLRARSVAIGTHALAHKVQQAVLDATPETASMVKAQVDGFLRLAGLWNRIDYGESKHIDMTVRNLPDWSRLSDAAKAEVRAALEAQLRADGQPVPAAPMGLPAPSDGQE